MVGFAYAVVRANITVAITRMEHTALKLRRHGVRLADASVVRRLLALALILDGHNVQMRRGWRGRFGHSGRWAAWVTLVLKRQARC